MEHNFQKGELVYLNHNAVDVPAKVLAVNDKGQVQLEVSGWIGTHWMTNTHTNEMSMAHVSRTSDKFKKHPGIV